MFIHRDHTASAVPWKFLMLIETASEEQVETPSGDLFDRHSRRGLAQYKENRFEDAVLSFHHALKIRRDAGILHNLGVAYARLKQLDNAAASFREALELAPQSAGTHANLALALRERGLREQALFHYAEAARLDAANPTAHYDLGRVLYEAGRHEEAAASFRECIRLNPRLWTAHHDLGRCLARLGKTDESIATYEEALRLKPDAADVHNNLGTLLEQIRKFPEAVQSFRRALRFDPKSSEIHSNLGVALAGQGQFDEAVGCYREALRLAPQSAEAHNNLGNALRTLGNLRESRFHLQEAIRLKPAYAEAHNNLGITRLQMAEPQQAMACYDRALELRQDYPEARLNRALALLAQGNMEEGWREYEWRWNGNGLKKRTFAQPEWAGETLPHGTVLLYTEQGLGDTIQFIRHASQVKERVGSVILEAHANLLPVLKGCPGITQFVPQGKPLPEFTAHCALLSLPRIFQMQLETIPTPVPYLFPEPERVSRWREVLRSIPGMKIGVAWQGNREFRGDRQRSLALRFFAPLAAIPGVSLVGLQKGEGTEQIQEVTGQFHVHTLAGLDEGAAFVDSAAVMSQLDLIVTSDTAIAHLAGALGRQVWVVLSAASDWRWLKHREDSPWYPTMRLFRQKQLGDWAEVFRRVAVNVAVHLQDGTPLVRGAPKLAPAAPAASVEALYRQGLDQLKKGRWAAGEPLLREVLRFEPDHVAARHNLGVALAKSGKSSEAAALLEDLLQRQPDMADGHNNLGLAYLDGGKPEKAEPAFRQAARLKPKSWDFRNNLGVALCRQDRLEEAAAAYREALAQRPDFGEAHTNLGHVLRLLGRLDEALQHCEQACKLRPNSADAQNNRGLVHRALGGPQIALTCFERALEINPEHAEARLNRALTWLVLGEFSRGWPEYECRWRANKLPERSFAIPRWDGSALAGRRILIHAEQGLGDCLQFIRFAQLIAQRGGRAVVEVPRELISLLSDCAGIDQLVARGKPLPECAVHCPLLSLPLLLQTRLDTIPAPVPYLTANSRRVAKWKTRLGALSGLKVGLAWQGNPSHPADRQRSLALVHFAELARVPGVQLVSLQRGPGSDQVARFKDVLPLHEFPDLDGDGNAFMDTAAVMMRLDLVITSDTAIAHLGGALGRPVWVVLPYAADWRWLIGRDDSPWYPSMRLFRQDRPGDWSGVMQRLAVALVQGPLAPSGGSLVPAAAPRSEDYYQRGLALLKKEQWAEGEACLREVLQRDPKRWAVHLNLGVALAKQKKLAQAVASFQSYLAANPNSVEGHNNIGLAYLELGQLPEAEKAFADVARLQPGNADYHNNLGVCLVRQNKHDEAIVAFRKAAELAPDKVSVLMNLANAFKHKKEPAQAIRCYEQLTRLRPDDAEALCSLGMAWSELGNRAQAAVYYRKAVALNPNFADARNNLGVALADLNEVEEAEEHLKEAVKLRPEHGETHRNLGIIQLMAGKFKDGWAEYEWRWRCNFPDPHAKTCPRWDGSPLAGRTLLLYAEQGLGDALQFIRYAPVVQQSCGRVVFECPKVLVSLFRSVPGIDELISQGSRLPRVDVAAPLLSLPFLLGTELDTVPAQVPYVHADPERVARWRQAFRNVSGFKVAISWQGSTKYAGDRQRSIPLKHFAPLASIPGVQLISLQKGVGSEQLGPVAGDLLPLDLGRQIDEDGHAFVDTAAIMKVVDLVITSDTAVAHLAGALGVPVWLMLHFAGDWRWLRGRLDSPWYPTMRLYRQETTGDWEGAFERARDALERHVRECLPNSKDSAEIPPTVSP